MIRGMSIPRKLAMSFFVIIGTAAVMLAVFVPWAVSKYRRISSK